MAAPVVAAPRQAEVTVTLSAREIVVGADRKGRATVRVSVPEGVHVNSDSPPARWLTPTRVEVRPVKAKVTYPTAVNDRFEGEVEIALELELPAGRKDAEFEIIVSYQACTESECQLAKEHRLDAVLLSD